jgi:adenylate cyclase
VSETRKLAAILVADIVGYSRLAGADEDRILARLRTLRSDLIDPTLAVHHGRVVKRTGDGAIIEFRSVVGYASYVHGRPSLTKSTLPSHCNVSLMR